MAFESIRLQTETDNVSGVSVIKVAGEIDVYTAPDFKAAISDAIESGATNLVLDLTGVSYMDSSGFGTLLGATKRIRPNGGAIHLTGCSEAIARMLRITRLDTIFSMYSTVEDAIQEMNSSKS